VFSRIDTKFVVEDVEPDLLHVVPMRDNPMLDRIFQDQDPCLVARFIAHVAAVEVAPRDWLEVLRMPDD
jgi:hypothetical protein